MDTENPIHPIVKEAEAFCASQGIGETALSEKATGDPNFIKTLRAGRYPKPRLVNRLRHFMLTGERLPGAWERKGPRKKASA